MELIGLAVVLLVLVRTWKRLSETKVEVDGLRERVGKLEADAAMQAARASVSVAPQLTRPPPSASETPAPPPAPARPSLPPLPVARPPVPAAVEAERPAPSDRIPEREPAPLRDPFAPVRAWLLGGNTMVRVGVVVLLFGVGFFLNFAIDQGWLPVEIRLMLAALGGMALTAAGWRLRERRRDYALVLQGGGIGIVYLTVFAAVNLYDLLATGPGLVLMVLLVMLSSALAVLQDSRSLAVLATFAGFAAPLLVSSEGSHVGLFSYYAALNIGVVGVAWFKEWRLLNLLGFVSTFLISGAWGERYYEPDHFWTTEPFLVAFFLMYVAVPVLFATRPASQEARYVDGSLLFGVPLVAFGLQAGLVRDFEYGLAFSALGAGLFYVGLATILWRRVPDTARILTEAFLALGVGFGTLTIPLAVDPRWTGSAWALEGAGLVWVGVRQRRQLAIGSGILLQLLAGGSFITATALPTSEVPVFNSLYIGALLVGVAGLFSAWYLHNRRPELQVPASDVSAGLLAWGMFWWFGAGLNEIREHVSNVDELAAVLVFTALSSLVVSWLRGRLAWPQLRVPVLVQLPVMLFLAAAGFLQQAHPFTRWSGAAWVAALAVHYWFQRRLESEWPERIASYWHAGMLWLVVFLLSWEVSWVMGRVGGMSGTGPVWGDVAWALIPGAAIAIVPRLTRGLTWPFARFANAYLAALTPIVVFVAAWVLFATFKRGGPAPLPYVPVINPLELAQCLVLAILIGLPQRALPWLQARDRWLAAAVLAFFVLNGIIARATHFYGGIAFDFNALWHAARFQSAISISWTVAAMAVMLGARSLAERRIWIAGAGLLLAVVVKLFLVDLEGVGTVARMISFVVVGLLILLVGYLSPLPPRSQEEPS